MFSLSKQDTLQKIPGLCPGLAEKRICNRTTTFETHPLLSPRWRLLTLRQTVATGSTPTFKDRSPPGHMSLGEFPALLLVGSVVGTWWGKIGVQHEAQLSFQLRPPVAPTHPLLSICGERPRLGVSALWLIIYRTGPLF